MRFTDRVQSFGFGWNNEGNGNIEKEIHILYDAAGVKLRKTVIDNTDPDPEVVKDYVGGIEYKDGDLEAVYHADGRIIPKSTPIAVDFI